jgi:hypothetical protein
MVLASYIVIYVAVDLLDKTMIKYNVHTRDPNLVFVPQLSR